MVTDPNPLTGFPPPPLFGPSKFLTADFVTGIDYAAPAASGLECGFPGGCMIKINGSHLHTHVKHGLSTVKICGRPCTFVENPEDMVSAWEYPDAPNL